MNVRLKMLQAVEREADNPQFYERACQFGQKAAQRRALGENRSQITGLEAIAESNRVSDVFNYVKLHTARQKGQEGWCYQNLGQDLLDYLERDLNRKRNEICTDLGQNTEDRESVDKQEVYRLLIRQFVMHMAAHYEYARME